MRINHKYHIYPQRIPLSFVKVLVLCLVLNLAESYGYAYDGNYPPLRDCIDLDFQAAFEQTLETRFGKTLQVLAKAKKIGIVLADITDRLNPKVAEVNGQVMLYAASLPKIAIVPGVFVEMERGKMKMDVYELVRGPFAWIAFAVFALISLYRIIFLLLTGKKEPAPNYSKSAIDAARSILHGLLPFGSTYMRKQPLFTLVTSLFHLCVVILPIFLLAHIVLWYESWEILWWSLPDMLADAMTLWVLLACLYFIGRRLFVAEVNQKIIQNTANAFPPCKIAPSLFI